MEMLEPRRFSRRQALRLAGLAAAGLTVPTWEPAGAAGKSLTQPAGIPSADEALRLLLEGNQRWVAARLERPNQSVERRTEVADGQQPFAIVFGCIDSRVPPELVFDRGLGDIFVVRTAGHVLDHASLGSIEFGVEELHVPLVLVLGHEACGAVEASVEAVEHQETAPGSIEFLVEGIQPAIEQTQGWPGDTIDNVVRVNTERTVAALRASEPILAQVVRDGRLQVVGARYDLDTGAVEIIA
jgi:carbonic anhydrase